MDRQKQLLGYKDGTILQGIYRCNGKDFGFLLTDEEHMDIFISDENRKSALNGDLVEVVVHKDYFGRHDTEGVVSRIVERATTRFVCTYRMTEDGGLGFPIDERVRMTLYIPKGNGLGAVTGARVIVEVISWPLDPYDDGVGKITEIIGYEGDKGLDIDLIIAQHNLPHKFPKEVLDYAHSLPKEIEWEKGLLDFRNLPLVTIDGPDSKDLDDAVYCEKKENGHYELGVHIADVSRYVKKGTSLDDEAYLRGTSVYLADRVIPMLPEVLSNDLCSLNAGVERYAMSCLMDVAPDGKVTTKKIGPSIIKVGRRCTYPEINQVFDEGIASEELKYYLPMLEDLKQCAWILRKDRERRGALSFEFPEYKVVLDPEGVPLRIETRIRKEAERIIEDAMIAANEAVARFLEETGHTSVYRIHEHPDEMKLDSLKKLMAIMGVPLRIPDDPEPMDIQKLLEEVKGKDFEAVAQTMTLRSLPQACYSTENHGHFGIASECYTHFTSPIRRYPDLMVHRLIRQAISDTLSKSERNKQTEFLMRAVEHCSNTEQNATQTERDVTDLKMAEYMEPFIGEVFEGSITGVTRFGIFVGLPNGVEGLVHIDSMMDDDYMYQEDTIRLVGRFSANTYMMGQTVKVTLVRVDKERREIDFVLGETKNPLELSRKSGKMNSTGTKKKGSSTGNFFENKPAAKKKTKSKNKAKPKKPKKNKKSRR